jgi:hypothetical protein
MILIIMSAILGGAAGFSIFFPYGILVACGSAPLLGSLAASLAAAALLSRRIMQERQDGLAVERDLTPLHALAPQGRNAEPIT